MCQSSALDLQERRSKCTLSDLSKPRFVHRGKRRQRKGASFTSKKRELGRENEETVWACSSNQKRRNAAQPSGKKGGAARRRSPTLPEEDYDWGRKLLCLGHLLIPPRGGNRYRNEKRAALLSAKRGSVQKRGSHREASSPTEERENSKRGR